MEDPELIERLATVEARLKHLENILGVREPGSFEVPPAPTPEAAVAEAQPAVDPFESFERQPVIPLREESIPFSPQPRRRWSPPPPLPSMAALSGTNPTPVIPLARLSSPSANDRPLEQTIGLKWTGWIGAVVLVIGVAFGIKFAHDRGWFQIVTPAIRVTLMAMGGLGLIAAGEVVFRKINRISAAGLFGAGVAVLFVVSYAGHAYYELYGRDAAFICMGLSTLIGTLIARRGGMVSIAVLSMIGGGLAPALLRSDHPNLTGFLTYLLLLQLTSLALCAWGASPKWWVLRGLSLAITSLWVLGVLEMPPREAVMFFSIIFAALYQAELIFSARQSMWGKASAGATFSILVTTGLTAVMLTLFENASASSRVVGLLALAGVIAGMGAICLRMHRSKSADGTSALLALAMGYAVQAIALLVVAVPIAVSGVWISAAWCMLAIVLATAGYVLDLRTPRVAAIAVWGLAVIDLLLWVGAWDEGARGHRPLVGALVPQFVLAGWGLAMGAQIVASITCKRRYQPTTTMMTVVAQWVSCLGVLLWVAASMTGLSQTDSTIAIVVLGWILLIGGQLDDALNLRLQAGIVFLVAATKWVIADTLAIRFAPGWTAGAQVPLLTPGIAMALVLAGSLGGFHFTTRRADGVLASWRAMLHAGTAGVLVLVWAGTMEIDRVVEHFVLPGSMGISQLQWKQLLWTSWWMICSGASLAVLMWTARGDAAKKGVHLRRWWKLPAWISVKFLLMDLLVYRLIADAAIRPIFAGPMPIAAVIVIGALVLLYWLSKDPQIAAQIEPQMRRWLVGLLVASAFVIGSVAIDQLFINQRLSIGNFSGEADHAEQVALSVFWSAFAVVSVVAGFIWRTAPLRYFGLTLFAVVLLKVVIVDMGQVSTGYRILSFIVLGLLLLGTSVLYGKLSPRLLGRPVPSAE
jgi:uncharacterized membrane protein